MVMCDVQYGTARQSRATTTVVWDSSPESGGDVALSTSSSRGRHVATSNPSEGRWYQYFAQGCCARMGDVVRQDRAYSIEVLLKLLSMYEEEFQELGVAGMSMESMNSVMFLLLTCLGGMRGYEAVWTDLAALKYDVEFCEEAEDYSAIAWPIVGRFKAHGNKPGCYMIPIAGTTKSGIQFFTWTQRFLSKLSMEGRTDGWAFERADGSRATASDYKRNIFSRLEVIQATTNLIDSECDVWEDFGVQRSGRRCFATVCTNNDVPLHLVELQARWQTDRAKGERTVQRTMLHTYSEIRNMKDSLVKPSYAF